MASKTPIRVAVTGAAGNIGYAAIFRLASGAVFGPGQPVALNLIEVGPGLNALTGVVNHLWLDPVMNTTFALIEWILKLFS